jgi:hypothetical protein
MTENSTAPLVHFESRVDGHSWTQRGFLAYVRLPLSKAWAPIVSHPDDPSAVTVIDPRVVIRDEQGQILFQGPTTEELVKVLFRSTVQGWRTSGRLTGEPLTLD